MTNDEIIANMKSILDSKDAKIAKLQGQLLDKVTPIAPIIPVVSPPVPISPVSYELVIKNMDLIEGGIYRSNKLWETRVAVLQMRINTPPKVYAKMYTKRRTNIQLDGKLNLKIMRVFPVQGNYPNDYLARGLNMNAEQFTVEIPTKTWGYFSMPFRRDEWIDETYEFFYVEKRVKFTFGTYVFEEDGIDFGELNRGQFGVQLVYAPLPKDGGGLPDGSYVEFKDWGLQIR